MKRYKNAVRVAAHRGNSLYYPENTLSALIAALKLPVDQLEIDLHMTRDGRIVLMHDHTVDRTTNGAGLVREMTLKEVRALDAGAWKGEAFRGERVPLFEEFLEMLQDYPEMTLNVEFKDYPQGDDADWAKKSADLSIRMIERYGIGERIWINSWSGEVLEYVDDKYGHAYKLHGYYPHDLMHGKKTREPYDYLHSVCLFGTKEAPVADKAAFDAAMARDVEPWCFFSNDAIESYAGAIANGCVMLTCNDPAKALAYLAERGLH